MVMKDTPIFQNFLNNELKNFDNKLDHDVLRLLKETKTTISVAESITSGLLSQRLTSLPGSSDYFDSGIICYSPTSKVKFCNVSLETIQEKGVVSAEVALEMVKGLKEQTSSMVCISTTGIAGPPNRDYTEKQTGLVYIGFYFNDKTTVKKFQFSGSREEIQYQATQAALGYLKQWLIAYLHDQRQ